MRGHLARVTENLNLNIKMVTYRTTRDTVRGGQDDRYCGSSEVTRINELIALIALIVVNSTGKACIDYTDELVE